MRKLFLTSQAVLLASVWFLLATLAVAAPNTDQPDTALSTREEPKNQQLAAEAEAQYKIAREIVTQMLEKFDEAQVDKIDPKQFGTSWVAILRLKRIASELEDAGETAGVDFAARAEALRLQWQKVKIKFFEVTKVNSSAIFLKVKADAEGRTRSFAAAKNFVDQQKWEDAEKIIHDELQELEFLACWLTGARRQPLENFEALRDQTIPKLRQQRSTKAKEKLAELRELTTPDFAQLLSQLEQGAKDLRAGQQPSFDGQPYTGPEFLRKAGETWRRLHWQALQSLGIDWARGLRAGEMDSQPLEDLLQSQKDFASNVVSAMAGVIEADAAGGNAADPVATYHAYIKTLAPLLSLTNNESNGQTLQAALDSYASSVPALSADVQAYDAVTSDLLRWKKRLAAAQQKNLAAKYPDFAAMALPSLQTLQSEEAASTIVTTGLVHRDAKQLNEVAVISSIPASLERMKHELVGQQVTLPSATGIIPAKKLVASHYTNRHYATFNLPAGYEKHVASLKADLLVSDNLPPLTLKAAMAIAAAERGDLEAAGVTLNRIYVEPLSTRMITLPAVASALVPLGNLPNETMGDPSLAQLLLRSDVQPAWVRNQYFFVPSQP